MHAGEKEVQWSGVGINLGTWVALLVNSTKCRLVAVAVMTLSYLLRGVAPRSHGCCAPSLVIETGVLA